MLGNVNSFNLATAPIKPYVLMVDIEIERNIEEQLCPSFIRRYADDAMYIVTCYYQFSELLSTAPYSKKKRERK
jgi:hypothetical protein